jgi:hypothetical protein
MPLPLAWEQYWCKWRKTAGSLWHMRPGQWVNGIIPK